MPKSKTPHPYLGPRNQLIGETITQLRKLRGLSQEELAARMRDRGADWGPSTLWALEKGHQSLRVAEAADLAAILGVGVAELVTADAVTNDTAAEVTQIWRETTDAERALRTAMGEHLSAARMGRQRLLHLQATVPDTWAALPEEQRQLALETVERTAEDILRDEREVLQQLGLDSTAEDDVDAALRAAAVDAVKGGADDA